MSEQTEATEERAQSEFGSGVVVCLAKFSEHIHPQMLQKQRRPDRENFSQDLEYLMNAASDHFYDLDHERSPAPLIELADLTLEIGHGFTGKTWTEADWERVRELWKASCLALDKLLGVEADWGKW